ncbi:MAG: hypothetical protein ACLRFM_02865 [Alphaproteobacteria bacterium]
MRKILFGLLGLLWAIPSWGACNLFDMDWLLNAPNWTKDGDVYSGPADSMWSAYASGGRHFPLTFAANTQYTFSGHVGANPAQARFTIGYTDGTSEMLSFGIDGDFLYTSSAGKTIGYVNFGNSSSGSIQLSNIQIERGTTATAYTPYDANCVERCVNMFNLSTATENSMVNANTGTIIEGNSGFYASDYISVRPNETYIISPARIGTSLYGMAWYDANKQYISGALFDPYVLRVTAPANAVFARTTYKSEWGDTFSFRPAYCSEIQVASTKYTETVFNPLNTALANAVATVNTVVTNTIAQAASIATLQSGKQTRPNDIADNNEKCPAYKQCLLVEDENGTPHWYQITDPFRDFVAPIIAHNVAPASTTNNAGYTQLEYIESTGTQYIDTGVVFDSNKEIEIAFQYISHDGTYNDLFGISASGSIPKSYLFRVNESGYARIYIGREVTTSFALNNNKHTIKTKNKEVYFDNESKGSYDNIASNPINAYLFATNLSGAVFGASVVKIYYTKIWNNGSLVRNFVPVRNNATGKYGLYDTVGQRFYGNAASSGDDFTPGPEVLNQDPDVPGMTWTATWAANASNGVSAGTVYGDARCTSVMTGNVGTSEQPSKLSDLQQAQQTAWNTPFTASTLNNYNVCWCSVMNIESEDENIMNNQATWVIYGRTGSNATYDCITGCAARCAQTIGYKGFRSALFGM